MYLKHIKNNSILQKILLKNKSAKDVYYMNEQELIDNITDNNIKKVKNDFMVSRLIDETDNILINKTHKGDEEIVYNNGDYVYVANNNITEAVNKSNNEIITEDNKINSESINLKFNDDFVNYHPNNLMKKYINNSKDQLKNYLIN